MTPAQRLRLRMKHSQGIARYAVLHLDEIESLFAIRKFLSFALFSR